MFFVCGVCVCELFEVLPDDLVNSNMCILFSLYRCSFKALWVAVFKGTSLWTTSA
jgi:hypothetical protein